MEQSFLPKVQTLSAAERRLQALQERGTAPKGKAGKTTIAAEENFDAFQLAQRKNCKEIIIFAEDLAQAGRKPCAPESPALRFSLPRPYINYVYNLHAPAASH